MSQCIGIWPKMAFMKCYGSKNKFSQWGKEVKHADIQTLSLLCVTCSHGSCLKRNYLPIAQSMGSREKWLPWNLSENFLFYFFCGGRINWCSTDGKWARKIVWNCNRALPRLPIYHTDGGQYEPGEKEKHAAPLEGMHAQLFWVSPSAGGLAAIWLARVTDYPRAWESTAKGQTEEKRQGTCQDSRGEPTSPPFSSTIGEENLTATNSTRPQPMPEPSHRTVEVRQGREQKVWQS